MSIEDDKIEEKSSENYTNSDYHEENLEKNNNKIDNNINEKSDKSPILSHVKINMIGNKFFKSSKSQRLSCQPVLSFLKRHDSNYSIRQAKTRKKTAVDFRNQSQNIFSPLIQNNSTILEKNQLINDNLKIKNKKKLENKGYIKVLNGNSNIYERSKKSILRKINYIKKKKEQQIQEINRNIKNQFMSKASQDIMENKSEYIPIQDRAIELHNRHLFQNLLHENYVKLKKKQEENKEFEIVYQYANKKTFDENNWEDFLNSQECWQKEKQFRAKAAELLRNTIEKDNRIPKINKKSELMINNIRKKILYIDDIHTKLYKDYDILQERKKLRMCNTMPSFKPFINKSVKLGKPKNLKMSNSSSLKFSKIFDKILKQKLNKNAKKNNKKIINNNSYTINYKIGLKINCSNYVYNDKILKDNCNLRKNEIKNEIKNEKNDYLDGKSVYNHNYENNIKSNKNQNISNKYHFYNKNNIKKINNVQIYKCCKSNSYVNMHNNKSKSNKFFNKNSNSNLYSRILK